MDEDEYLEWYGREPSLGSVYQLTERPAKVKPREFPIGFHQPKRKEIKMSSVKCWYMASPYSGHEKGREYAFRSAAANAGLLMGEGVEVFSPICHTHPIEQYCPSLAVKPHSFWMDRDRVLFDKCDGLLVLTDPGWLTSTGVTQEVGWARERGIPILYMTPGVVPDELKKGN